MLIAISIAAINFTNSKAQLLNGDDLPYIEGELIVQIKQGIDIRKVIATYPLEYNFELRELSPIMRAWLVKFDLTKINHFEAKMLLSGDRNFSIVQNNHKVTLRSVIPNDPQFNQQWHHLNTGQNNGTVDADIDTDEAWEITTGGTTALGHDIVVCIIEGANMTHPDLIDNRWVNTAEIPGNGIDDDGNGYVDDVFGWNVAGNNGNVGTGDHGTSVAGMIGARGNNGIGVVGANWNVKIMIVSGHNANNEANIIAAYNYPLTLRKRFNETNGAEGALVVATNASWGIDGGNPASVPLWCAFYDTLGVYGILNCGATTNSNLNVDVAGDIPTACPSPYMIGVGRSDRNDNFVGGYGLTTIDLAAPGINVRTTNSNSYTTTTGTSFASPLTAGVIALMYSIPCTNFASLILAHPQMGADFVRQALLDGVDPKPQLANFFITGGRLNAKNSIDLLMAATCDGICLPPANISVNNIGENFATVTWNPANNVLSYNLYYRAVGSSNWTSQNISNTTFTINGLDACASYEFYVESDCDSTISTPSAIITFNTLGCGNCIDLPYCESFATGSNQIALTVTTPSNIANNYVFQAPTTWGANLQNTYAAGELVIVDDGTTNGQLGCSALVNAAQVNGKIAVVYRGDCQFGTKALNAQNAGAIGVIVINNVSGTIDMAGGNFGSQINIPVAMISNDNGATIANSINAGNNVFAILGTKAQWLQSATIGAFVSNSGNNNGYGNFLNSSNIELNPSGNFTLTLTPGFGNQPYGLIHKAWIDYNQDGQFSTDELIYESSALETGNVIASFTIPANAQLGSTRLRIVTAYIGPGQTTAPNACGQFIFGETEDYCVTMMDSCSFIATVTKTDPTCVGINNGSAVVNVTNAVAPITYEWSHDLTLTSNIAQNLGAQDYSVKITDGNNCSETKFFTLNQPPASVVGYISSVESLTVTFTNTSTPGSYLWNFGDGNSSVEINPTHTYQTDGNYQVCLQLTDACGVIQTCQNIEVRKELSLNNWDISSNAILIYPNPTRDIINFEINHETVKFIEIYHITGKLIKNIMITQPGVLPINFGKMSDGVYFYKAIDSSGAVIKTERIVVSK